jgi:hypothetical protein
MWVYALLMQLGTRDHRGDADDVRTHHRGKVRVIQTSQTLVSAVAAIWVGQWRDDFVYNDHTIFSNFC